MSKAGPSGSQPWEQKREVRIVGDGTHRTPTTVGREDGIVVGGPAVGATPVLRRHHPLLRLKRRLARI